MGKLFNASIKMIYRDKQALFWAIAFPLLFAIVFGLFDFTSVPDSRVVVVQPAIPAYAPAVDSVESALKEIEFFDVSRIGSVAAGKTAIEEADADIVVEVTATGPQDLTVSTYYNGANPQGSQQSLIAMSRVVDGMNLQMAGVTEPAVEMKPVAIEAHEVSYYDFLLPGLVAMGVMNYSIAAAAVGIARLREQMILKRILATPLRPSRFLGGQVAAHLTLAVVQACLILAVGIFMFGGNVYGSIVAMVALVVLANIIFLNIGVAIAGRSKNAESAAGAANVVALPMMFLSGVFFPIETLPTLMQGVVQVLPLTPLIDAMRKISVEGLPITDCLPQIAALSVWVVVSFALARMNFSFGEKSA